MYVYRSLNSVFPECSCMAFSQAAGRITGASTFFRPAAMDIVEPQAAGNGWV